jgi:integrase
MDSTGSPFSSRLRQVGWDHHQEGPARFWDLRRELLKEAGLERTGRGYHIDRHTYTRDFVVLGGRFEELQKSLRHISIRTTETLHGHFHEDVAAALARERIYRNR